MNEMQPKFVLLTTHLELKLQLINLTSKMYLIMRNHLSRFPHTFLQYKLDKINASRKWSCRKYAQKLFTICMKWQLWKAWTEKARDGRIWNIWCRYSNRISGAFHWGSFNMCSRNTVLIKAYKSFFVSRWSRTLNLGRDNRAFHSTCRNKHRLEPSHPLWACISNKCLKTCTPQTNHLRMHVSNK